jgi:hypothetical protein
MNIKENDSCWMTVPTDRFGTEDFTNATLTAENAHNVKLKIKIE